ncbi:unnamed protein product, partial [Boreogadus saida]
MYFSSFPIEVCFYGPVGCVTVSSYQGPSCRRLYPPRDHHPLRLPTTGPPPSPSAGNCMHYLGENGLSMSRVILTEKEKDEVLSMLATLESRGCWTRSTNASTGRQLPEMFMNGVTEVTDNNLVQLETLDGKPLKTRSPYASVKPVRRRSQAAWPTKETVSNLSEPADSELEEDPLEDLDVVITSVQPGRAYPASLSKRAGEVQLFPRAMRSPTAEPFVIDVDVHCLCRRTIGQGKAPLVPCR